MCDMVAWVGGSLDQESIEHLGKLCSRSSNTHATGVALNKGPKKSIQILKAPTAAEQFFTFDWWKNWHARHEKEVFSGLIHARYATNGPAHINVNNHPHWSDSGSVLTHKGMVHEQQHFQGKSQCDSEQALLSFDAFGLVEGVKNLGGWATFFYYPHYMPGKLLIYTNSSPVGVVELAESDIKIYHTVLNIKDTRDLPTKRWIMVDVKSGEEEILDEVDMSSGTVTYMGQGASCDISQLSEYYRQIHGDDWLG